PDLLVRSQTLYPAELPAHLLYRSNMIPLAIEFVNCFRQKNYGVFLIIFVKKSVIFRKFML
ncbi:MAG: hypothetical protein J1F24_06990, partial [Oscillospiraceae bacterium]|nr:hypothetical protein [Oscillospiraceae bacterium]